MNTHVLSIMWRETLEQLCEKAIDFIVETQEENDYICEPVDWLNFIRPQKSWKPSEEQIKALSIAVKHGQKDDPDALKELLKQLKAL